MRGMSAFAAVDVDFDTVFAVYSNVNDSVFDVCCQFQASLLSGTERTLPAVVEMRNIRRVVSFPRCSG